MIYPGVFNMTNRAVHRELLIRNTLVIKVYGFFNNNLALYVVYVTYSVRHTVLVHVHMYYVHIKLYTCTCTLLICNFFMFTTQAIVLTYI